MDRTIHLLDRRLEVTSHDELGDQFARMWTDDMRTEELTVLLVPDDLHEAVSITHRPSTTTRTPWERADLDIVPCLLRLRLSHPDRCDFRVAVGNTRDIVVVDPSIRIASDELRGSNPLMRGLVREEGRLGAVADSEDTLDSGTHLLVDGDKAVLGLDARSLEADILDHRNPAYSREDAFDLYRLLLVADLHGELYALLADISFLQHRPTEDFHPTLLEGALDDSSHIRVLEGEDMIHRLDDRDLGSEGIEDIGELESDRAAPDHCEGLRRLFCVNRMIGAPDLITIDLEDRELAGPRASREDDILGLDDLLLALPRRLLIAMPGILAWIYLDLPITEEASPTLDMVDLVLTEEEGDTLRT